MNQAVASSETYGKSARRDTRDPQLRPDSRPRWKMGTIRDLSWYRTLRRVTSPPWLGENWVLEPLLPKESDVQTGQCPLWSPLQGDQRHLPPTQPAWPPHHFQQDQPHLGCFWLGQMPLKHSAVTCLPHPLHLCSKMPTEACCAFLERKTSTVPPGFNPTGVQTDITRWSHIMSRCWVSLHALGESILMMFLYWPTCYAIVADLLFSCNYRGRWI